MEKIPQVEVAKALMTEAISWSVVKWLREKKRVRKAADQANAALDELHQAVKDRWPETTRTAYEALLLPEEGSATTHHQRKLASKTAPQAILTLRKIKDADEEAYRTRMDAERLFDDAEKQLSTSLAREGCRRAIQSWELFEQAIRKAEAAIPPR
ncbi:MAG: hypothetical protein ACLQLC_19645 [Candidatus Sulfotelmatobacter sp.]